MKYYFTLLPRKAIESFARAFSTTLDNEYNIQLKPIKVLHAFAKALDYKNWGAYNQSEPNRRFPHYKSLHNAKPAGINRYVKGRSGSGKSTFIQG